MAQAPCTITDAATGDAIPYANVYVPALGTGLVTDALGQVRLSPKLRDADPTTPTTVSCIGYEDADITLTALRERGEAGAYDSETCIALAPAAYTLAGVEVRERAYDGPARELGFRKDRSSFSSGYSGGGGVTGAEVGNVMRCEGEWLLTGVGLNVHVDTPIVAELNVYELPDVDEAPGARLHRERLVVNVPTCHDAVHNHALDVRAFGITGRGNFLVTIEPLGLGIDDDRGVRLLPPDSPELAREGIGDVLDDTILFNSKVALRPKRRVTRMRTAAGEWKRTPAGFVVGIYAEVKTPG